MYIVISVLFHWKVTTSCCDVTPLHGILLPLHAIYDVAVYSAWLEYIYIVLLCRRVARLFLPTTTYGISFKPFCIFGIPLEELPSKICHKPIFIGF